MKYVNRYSALVAFMTWRLFATFASAQSNPPPTIEWQASVGRGGIDELYAAWSLPDGGFVLGGWSQGPTNFTPSTPDYGFQDMWVVRQDATGQLLWQLSLGGNSSDCATGVVPAPDGGICVVGNGYSGVSGNKSSQPWGGGDVWVVKLDDAGNKLWDLNYGGSSLDIVYATEPTVNGLLMGGLSFSPRDGTKLSAGPGAWVVLVDYNGFTIWDYSFGIAYDTFYAVKELPSSGFILGGASAAEPGPTKSAPHFGGYDYYLVRLNGNGQPIWERTFGGTNDDLLTSLDVMPDGGFILGGLSRSDAGGNKTTPRLALSPAFFDFWLIRVDANGNKLWERTVNKSVVGPMLVLAVKPSGIMVAGGVAGQTGSLDNWLARLDERGTMLWEFYVGGSTGDYLNALRQCPDRGFLLAGTSRSDISGSKTAPAYGYSHFWTIKLAPEILPDTDQDGVPDEQDHCPGTASGVSVDANGCSIEQRVPCSAPWNNHGQYLKAVRAVADEFLHNGLINQSQKETILSEAVRSDCGK
jgi:hypothetical protein